MDRDIIANNGWRQGAFASENAIKEIASDKAGQMLIILSQDCDILNDKEPKVEGIWACKESNPDRKSNSPRRIDIEVKDTAENNTFHVKCLAHDRVVFDRAILKNHVSNNNLTLSPHERNRLIRMIIKRYDRLALPDEFNKRLNTDKTHQKISKRLKGSRDFFSGLYIRLQPDDRELPENENYKLSMLLLQTSAQYDQSYIEADDLASEIENLLRKCKNGIDLISPGNNQAAVASLPENSMSLEGIRHWKLWDYWEYLSSDEDDETPVRPPSL